MMTFQEKLENYANLLVACGMNVQPGQDVFIQGELIHRNFIQLLIKSAYKAGARMVIVDMIDPETLRSRLLYTKDKSSLAYLPDFIPVRYDQMIDNCSASLRLLGSEEPDILADMNPVDVNTVQLEFKKRLKNFYKEGVGHSKVQWSIAAASTPKWAMKVFPKLKQEEAHLQLWNDIFHICRADKADCIALWKEHNEKLHKRAAALNALHIDTLHFTGPGTDLRVGLSPKSIFRGGSDKSPRGADFIPNIPTEEVWTTPHNKRTEGFVTTTRPFLINGKMIRGLKLTFKAGLIVDFSATEGQETFAEYSKSDPGAKRLGEMALVGIDSPLYQTGRIYEEILFDENAACHIAMGSAYHNCIAGSEKMSAEELEDVGCNTSNVHTDMMISSVEVDCVATLADGKILPLIKKGAWVWS